MDAIFLSSCVPKQLTPLMRPLGPYQVAWYLRKHNYNVQVLEFIFRLTEEEILNLIHPHFYIINSEYKDVNLGTKNFVTSYGGQIKYVDPIPTISTTKVIT